MNTKFSKALLMSGKDLTIAPGITLHHPDLGEILSIHQSSNPDAHYWSYVHTILSDPYYHMVILDDMGRNYLEVSPYELFQMQWGPHAAEALQFFIVEKHNFQRIISDDGTACFYDISDSSCRINEEIFISIREWIKAVNKIDHSARIKPADENARRVLIEDMRDELKKAARKKRNQENDSDSLGSIMSAVSFCGNGSLTPFHMIDCKIYWLNEAFSIANKKNHADHIMDAVYHGMIRYKDINKEEIEWIK